MGCGLWVQVRGGRGSGPGRGSRGGGVESTTTKKREAILDLSVYLDKRVKVEFVGGRVVVGTLKGYDQLLNLVMDQIEEQTSLVEPTQRSLGLAVLRGTSLVVLSPLDG